MKNCCDYDAIVHYAPGTLGSKYKTVLDGKLMETELDQSLRETDVKSFRDSFYRTYITTEPIVLYRVYGQYQKEKELPEGKYPHGARLQGRYVSTEFAESAIDAKLRLALDPSWMNTKMCEAKLLVPAGVKISVGVVASVTTKTETILPGGADQILLPAGWPKEWVQGYRRVTARQLQTMPFYWAEEPDEISVGKGKLYPKLCPACGYPHIEELKPDEQFEIVGIKGGHYWMKRRCLNPRCAYYW